MRAIRESWSQAFLAETVEAGDKNRGVRCAACGVRRVLLKASCMFCEAFPERVGPRILSLESIDYFGTSEYVSGRKKESFMSKTSMVRLTGWVL